jgi:uncharacterized protein (TIGR00290 family)
VQEKVIFSWSGGKDSALALYELRKAGDYEIVTLLTTVTRDYDRICMHGVRKSLLEQQAEALGLPLETMFISKGASNDEYESAMRQVLTRHLAAGVRSVAFGDVFLEELRAYRQQKLSKIGMKGLFPLWRRNTVELAHTFLNLGFKAVITSVDSKCLQSGCVGRAFDEEFLTSLPPAVDPCGENGEFHSFVYDGPIFSRRVLHVAGKVILRENGFYYCDLTPHNNGAYAK